MDSFSAPQGIKVLNDASVCRCVLHYRELSHRLSRLSVPDVQPLSHYVRHALEAYEAELNRRAIQLQH